MYKNSVSYQKFSVKPFSKGLRVKGGVLSPTGVGEIYFTECAPQEVNFKIVRCYNRINDRDEIIKLALYSKIKNKEPIAPIDEKLLEYY